MLVFSNAYLGPMLVTWEIQTQEGQVPPSETPSPAGKEQSSLAPPDPLATLFYFTLSKEADLIDHSDWDPYQGSRRVWAVRSWVYILAAP